MKVFIWQHVYALTTNYHDGGGVVVVASSLERARELIFIESTFGQKPIEPLVRTVIGPKPEQKVLCDALTKDPDFIAEILTEIEKVFIFPNAVYC